MILSFVSQKSLFFYMFIHPNIIPMRNILNHKPLRSFNHFNTLIKLFQFFLAKSSFIHTRLNKVNLVITPFIQVMHSQIQMFHAFRQIENLAFAFFQIQRVDARIGFGQIFTKLLSVHVVPVA